MRGGIEEIRNYYEMDVLNTYLVYLRYMLLTGALSGEVHDGAVKEVKAYLGRESAARPHLCEFAERSLPLTVPPVAAERRQEA